VGEREVGDHVRGAVVKQECDGVAGFDAEAAQAGGDAIPRVCPAVW